MRTIRTIVIPLLFALTNCSEGDNVVDIRRSDSANTVVDSSVQTHTNDDIKIDCDSVFTEKGYKIVLAELGTEPDSENSRRFVFRFFRHSNERDTEIFNDTIESSAQVTQFMDYNGDETRDILIQNYSDVRSNWTYHLFLFDGRLRKLKKIRGFEEIKNPTYLAEQNIVTNYVNSGTNWTSFYKIQADSVIDLGILIEDDLSDDGAYKRKYDRAITDIERRMKNTR